MPKKLYTFALVFAVLLSGLPLTAQTDRQLERQKKNSQTEKRLALIIGNGAYTKANPLPNPTNDATDMARVLRDVGFEVLSGVNQNKRQMETLIREFGNKLANGGVGLFYYAGHGIQVNGENYLVPIEADIPEEDEVSYSAVPVNLVLRKMATANNDLNIVILDACRNNPFARSWRTFRSGENNDGLAKITPPTGTLVLYATEPGKVASDGDGRNGLFTEALLKNIKKPNLEYDQMVRAVSADVWQKSNKQQLPWKEGNSLQDFYFVKGGANVVTNPIPTDKPNEPTIVAKDRAAQEREAWDLVKNSADAEDFRFFLKEFPDGANKEKAKIRLEELVWQSVRGADKTKIQAYLNEFPNGANAAAARIRIRQLETAGNPTTKTSGNTTANRTAGAVSKATLPGGAEMSFAYIPAGEFQMGSNQSDNEKPIHTVRISQGFFMGQTEVTQAQWQSVMRNNPSYFINCPNCPVEQVSWEDAQQFIAKLNAQNDGYKYRLPTEAEWEYAARAGTTGDYAGNLDSMGWFWENSGDQRLSGEWNFDKLKAVNGRTHPVGTKQPNAWGLYDMQGNVWEWVQDWFDVGYYAKSPATDPVGPASGSDRVGRGGCWTNHATGLSWTLRFNVKPSSRYLHLGFRVVRQ